MDLLLEEQENEESQQPDLFQVPATLKEQKMGNVSAAAAAAEAVVAVGVAVVVAESAAEGWPTAVE